MDALHNLKKESTALLILVPTYGVALITIMTENASTFLIVSNVLLGVFTIFTITIMRDTTNDAAEHQRSTHPTRPRPHKLL